jgi:hypothetical protein
MQTTNGFTVEVCSTQTSPIGANQTIWSISPSIEYRDSDNNRHRTDFVLTSAANVPFQGWETYIFPCDEDGNVLNWLELPGSFKGEPDHEKAIMGINHAAHYDW